VLCIPVSSLSNQKIVKSLVDRHFGGLTNTQRNTRVTQTHVQPKKRT